MSEYINKIIIPTLDGECELSTSNVRTMTLPEYNKLDPPEDGVFYIIPDIKVYLGTKVIWENPNPKYGKNVLAGAFTENSTPSNWKWYKNDSEESLVEYTNPYTKEFYLDLDEVGGGGINLL